MSSTFSQIFLLAVSCVLRAARFLPVSQLKRKETEFALWLIITTHTGLPRKFAEVGQHPELELAMKPSKPPVGSCRLLHSLQDTENKRFQSPAPGEDRRRGPPKKGKQHRWERECREGQWARQMTESPQHSPLPPPGQKLLFHPPAGSFISLKQEEISTRWSLLGTNYCRIDCPKIPSTKPFGLTV